MSFKGPDIPFVLYSYAIFGEKLPYRSSSSIMHKFMHNPSIVHTVFSPHSLLFLLLL